MKEKKQLYIHKTQISSTLFPQIFNTNALLAPPLPHDMLESNETESFTKTAFHQPTGRRCARGRSRRRPTDINIQYHLIGTKGCIFLPRLFWNSFAPYQQAHPSFFSTFVGLIFTSITRITHLLAQKAKVSCFNFFFRLRAGEHSL